MTVCSLVMFPKLESVSCSMSSSNCWFLTHTQLHQEAGKVVWYSHLFKNFPVCCDSQSQSFSIVSEEETDVLLEFSWFFCDATDVGSLVSGSFALSKHSFYIWKLLVYILLKPSLKDFMHNFASMGFPGVSASKESTCNAGDLGSILGFGRSPGEGNSYTLQCYGLKNSVDCIVVGLQTARYDWATFTLLAWGMSAIVK